MPSRSIGAFHRHVYVCLCEFGSMCMSNFKFNFTDPKIMRMENTICDLSYNKKYNSFLLILSCCCLNAINIMIKTLKYNEKYYVVARNIDTSNMF